MWKYNFCFCKQGFKFALSVAYDVIFLESSDLSKNWSRSSDGDSSIPICIVDNWRELISNIFAGSVVVNGNAMKWDVFLDCFAYLRSLTTKHFSTCFCIVDNFIVWYSYICQQLHFLVCACGMLEGGCMFMSLFDKRKRLPELRIEYLWIVIKSCDSEQLRDSKIKRKFFYTEHCRKSWPRWINRIATSDFGRVQVSRGPVGTAVLSTIVCDIFKPDKKKFLTLLLWKVMSMAPDHAKLAVYSYIFARLLSPLLHNSSRD